MFNNHESLIAYFMSITHCQRHNAIQLLEKNNWKLDLSLNLFFEYNCNEETSNIRSNITDASYQQ